MIFAIANLMSVAWICLFGVAIGTLLFAHSIAYFSAEIKAKESLKRIKPYLIAAMYSYGISVAVPFFLRVNASSSDARLFVVSILLIGHVCALFFLSVGYRLAFGRKAVLFPIFFVAGVGLLSWILFA